MTPEPSSSRIPDRIERSERDRVRRVYSQYDSSDYHRRIWSENRVLRRILDHKWERIGEVLNASRIEMSAVRVLDIGTADGRDAARFRDLGVAAQRILAFDLREPSLRSGRIEHPWMSAVAGDAAELPFRTESIDIVYQSTMISSILAPAVRQRILTEVSRVIVPGGVFLSYDTRYPNPANRNTMPLRARELREAFKGWSVRTWSVTAIPQLQRMVGGISLVACGVLERIPFLRAHLLALVRKPF